MLTVTDKVVFGCRNRTQVGESALAVFQRTSRCEEESTKWFRCTALTSKWRFFFVQPAATNKSGWTSNLSVWKTAFCFHALLIVIH